MIERMFCVNRQANSACDRMESRKYAGLRSKISTKLQVLLE